MIKRISIMRGSVFSLLGILLMVGPFKGKDAVKRGIFVKSRSFKISKLMIGRRDPVLPDVLIVKQRTESFTKAPLSLTELQQQAAVTAVEPMFPLHYQKRLTDKSDLARIFAVHLSPGTDVFKAAEVFSQHPSLEYAEPWYLRKPTYDPNDPGISNQWYINKVQSRQAWDIQKNDTIVVIAIIDTGVDWDHPDLRANVWINSGEIPNNGIDDDGNGYIDDIHGWDFGGKDYGQPDNDPMEARPYHGTAVAGVASAVTDNGIGIAAPAFNAKFMPVKTSVDADSINHYIVFGSQGIVYAVDNGADIINCSYGGTSPSNFEMDVINYASSAGVLVVAAAGNKNNDTPIYPASYKGVLSVAATDSSDIKTNFSTYGYSVDVSAPGVGMYSTWSHDEYTWLSGTSFSAPLTASIAALLKGQHLDWNGEQLREQIRISADPIDNLNPQYAKKLGFGRVNAFRALTISSPAIRLTQVAFSDSLTGNSNNIIDPGEEILITLTLKNYLVGAYGVSISLTTDDPYITVTTGTVSYGSMISGSQKANTEDPFRFTVATAAPEAHSVDFIVLITADGGYQDYDHFSVEIQPLFASVKGGNVELTLSATGRLGFIDYPINQQGVGFLFGNPPENLLFEGAVMAATDSAHVSDVARGSDQEKQNNDFLTAPDGQLRIFRPSTLADEQGEARFTDGGASSPIDLAVMQTSLAFYNPPDEDFVLLAFQLQNNQINPIENLHFGLFIDWDIGDPYQNKAGFDTKLSLGYVYDPSRSVYAGLQVVSGEGATIYSLVDNPARIYDGYTKGEKWEDLSGGITIVGGDTPSDYSHLLGVGPLTIAPGEHVLVGFTVLGGNSLSDLQANAQAAQEKWRAIFEATHVEDRNSGDLPTVFALEQNFPNPFNPETYIHYDVPQRCRVQLTIYNLLGQEVARLVDEEQAPGRYQVRWDGRTNQNLAPSGIYFFELQAGRFQAVRKMLLLH